MATHPDSAHPTSTVRELIAALAETEDALRDGGRRRHRDRATRARRRAVLHRQHEILTALHALPHG